MNIINIMINESLYLLDKIKLKFIILKSNINHRNSNINIL